MALAADLRVAEPSARIGFRQIDFAVSTGWGGARRLAADLGFWPPVPQLAALDWQGVTAERYIGWAWLALRRVAEADPRFAPAMKRAAKAEGKSWWAMPGAD